MTVADSVMPKANASTALPVRRVAGVTKNSVLARRKLLEAAYHLFSRQGFKATSAEQIADRAGYSQAAIFFHFKTKAGLLKACLDEALEQAKASLPVAERRGTIHLLGALDSAFDDYTNAELFARLMLEQNHSAVIQPIYAAFHAHVRDLICAELRHDTGAKADRCFLAAGALLSMLIGVHAAYRVEHTLLERQDYRAMLINVTTLVVASLKSDSAAKSGKWQRRTPHSQRL
jgi:AcrR family transcriptional regulator